MGTIWSTKHRLSAIIEFLEARNRHEKHYPRPNNTRANNPKNKAFHDGERFDDEWQSTWADLE